MNDWELLRSKLEKIYKKDDRPDFKEIEHAINTEEWLLKMNPKASDEVRLSAYAHDIERAFFEKRMQKEYEPYLDHKLEHSKRSADIVCAMMYAFDFTIESIQKVHYLICNHEVGGDEDANLVRDADSLSYFENNLPGYYRKRGKERTQMKIKFMYERASDKAKELVKTIKFENDLKYLLNETLTLDL